MRKILQHCILLSDKEKPKKKRDLKIPLIQFQRPTPTKKHFYYCETLLYTTWFTTKHCCTKYIALHNT